jgi:hypothetical protein
VALLSVGVGLSKLSDNSFLTHLTTGRLILSSGIPHADPYSFTGFGRHWVVQSWLASLLYALADRLAGGAGIRALVTLVTVLLGLSLWRLTRRARSLLGRIAAVAVPLVIGTVAWGSRPLLFGLLFFALMMIIVEERRDPRWLVPLMWLWVNTHGSFPLGLVYLLLVLVGDRLDGRETGPDVSLLKWALLGTLLGAINPVGPEILWFPIELLRKRHELAGLIEWQAPTFTDLWQQLFLLGLLLVAVLSPRLPHDRRYRSMLLVGVFTVAALLGSRNVVVASIVFVPVLALELRDVGSLSSAARRPIYGMFTAVFAVLCVLALAAGLTGPSYNLASYPTQSVSWLEANHLLTPRHRLAARDFVGNYLEYRYRGRVRVFVDDRLDMFPPRMAKDEGTLLSGRAGWSEVLDRYRIDEVLWETSQPLSGLLRESPKWRVAHTSGKWTVFERVNPLPSS